MVKPATKHRRKDSDDRVFRALAGAERRRILDLLRDRPLTTGDICKELVRLDRCTVMQHLRVLEDAGLVISRKKGRCRWNYLDIAPVQRIHERWISDYTRPAADILSRLRADLEGL